jgi:Lrp/AsnC family transcriptional regulator for asnA, asnC and gidA
VLEIIGLVDPETVPRHRVVMVGVKLSTMDLVKKGAEFSRMSGSGIGQCGHRPL